MKNIITSLLENLKLALADDLNNVVVDETTIMFEDDDVKNKDIMDSIFKCLKEALINNQKDEIIDILLELKDDTNKNFILWLIDYIDDLENSYRISNIIKTKSKNEFKECIEFCLEKMFISIYSFDVINQKSDEVGNDYLKCVLNLTKKFVEEIIWKRWSKENCKKSICLASCLDDDYFDILYDALYIRKQDLIGVLMIQKMQSLKKQISDLQD